MSLFTPWNWIIWSIPLCGLFILLSFFPSSIFVFLLLLCSVRCLNATFSIPSFSSFSLFSICSKVIRTTSIRWKMFSFLFLAYEYFHLFAIHLLVLHLWMRKKKSKQRHDDIQYECFAMNFIYEFSSFFWSLIWKALDFIPINGLFKVFFSVFQRRI